MQPDMASLTYVLMSAGWSILGFVLGFVFGRVGRSSSPVRRPTQMNSHDTTTDPPSTTDRSWQRVFGVALILISIFTVAQAWYQINQDRDTLRCQVQFNEAISTSLQQRSKYDDQNREALLNMLTAFGNVQGPKPDPEAQAAAQKAFTTLIETYQRTEQARRDNPIPDVPTGRCD